MHQVIEECGCSGDCYRMTHIETVLDFSEVEIRDGSNSTEVKPLVRVSLLIVSDSDDRITFYNANIRNRLSTLANASALVLARKWRPACCGTRKIRPSVSPGCIQNKIPALRPDSRSTSTGNIRTIYEYLAVYSSTIISYMTPTFVIIIIPTDLGEAR